MNEAVKAQAEALFKSREAERAEFEAQLQAQRDKTARLRALRLAREEAKWEQRRPQAIENSKAGLATLHETTAQMRASHPSKNTAKTG